MPHEKLLGFCFIFNLHISLIRFILLQEIRITENVNLVAEQIGDTIAILKNNVWEVIFNLKTGTIESWKVKVKVTGELQNYICSSREELSELIDQLHGMPDFDHKSTFLP